MKIHVQYMAQLKRAAGTSRETVELDSPGCVHDLLQSLSRSRQGLLPFIWNGNHGRRPSLLVTVGERMLAPTDNALLQDDDTVILMTPMSGG